MIIDLEKLKALRDLNALTQEALAGMSRLSVRTIQRAENGESISSNNIIEIAHALKVDLSELVKGDSFKRHEIEDVASVLDWSELPKMPFGKPNIFFERRFKKAFPGQRDVRVFENVEDIELRLLRLLEPPLVYMDGQPIWYWFDGEMYIERLKKIGKNHFLMNNYELKIKKLISVYSQFSGFMFVYVEAAALEPTGCNLGDYFIDKVYLENPFEYAFELYGVYKGQKISYEEYMDGAFESDQGLVDLDGTEELRERPLTSFNFIIAPHYSVINNRQFDDVLPRLLKQIRLGLLSIEDFTDVINSLPRR